MKRQTFQSVVGANCTHLSLYNQNKLLELLIEFENRFDETLGDWNAEPVFLCIKGRHYAISQQAVPSTKSTQRHNSERK
jgi:hypothetical protein